MNVLKICTAGFYRNATVTVDGTPVRFERQKNGDRVATVNTEKSEVELSVFKLSEVSDRFWYLWNMLFFIISVFGIFCPHYDKRTASVRYVARLKLNPENAVLLQFNRFAEGTPAIDCRRDCEAEEFANEYYTDKLLKKRFRILALSKALVWLALIALAIVLILKVVIGF